MPPNHGIQRTASLGSAAADADRSTTKNRKKELGGLVSAEIILENPREPNR